MSAPTINRTGTVNGMNGWKPCSRHDDLLSWRKGYLSLCIMSVDGITWQVEVGFLEEDHEASQAVWSGKNFSKGLDKCADIMSAI